MEDERLTYLINRYLDKALDDAEKSELEQSLLESASARQHFWQQTTLHGAIHESAKLKWRQVWHGEEPASAWAGELLPQGRDSMLPSWKALLALAALLMFLGYSFYSMVWERDVAFLVRTVEPSWADPNTPLAPGNPLSVGIYDLQSGSVQIRFLSGAEMILESPATFEILSDDMVDCRLGRFRVIVPESAHGFTVRLAQTDVVDLGTEFGVTRFPEAPPEVHVFSGEVEVNKLDGKAATLFLLEGEGVRVEEETFTRIEASHYGFLTELSLKGRALAETRQRHHAWQEASDVLGADPSTLLHYTFQSESSWSSQVRNQVKLAPHLSHGQMVECDWTEGRWPGKRALQFDQAADRVRFSLNAPMESFTLLAWVRVDSLPNGFVHSLISGGSEEPGTVRWTIGRAGTIRVGLAKPSSNPEASWTLAESKAVFTSERLGQWQMITFTFDGRQGHIYLNAERVWSGTLNGPGVYQFGKAELGNWVAHADHSDFQWAKGKGNSFFDRHFEGRIDEVAVMSRPMSPEEISGYYEVGKPLRPNFMVQAGDKTP